MTHENSRGPGARDDGARDDGTRDDGTHGSAAWKHHARDDGPSVRFVAAVARSSHVVFAALVATTVALLRLPVFFTRPFNSDELYYAVGASRLLAGGLLYRDVVDHKAPGIYWIYAGLFRLAGHAHLAVVHAALIASVTATAVLIAIIGARLFGRRSGRAAGLVYAVASGIGPAGDFLAANCELFMNLPAIAAMALVVSPLVEIEGRGRATLRMTLVGLLVAGAALIKFQGAAIALPIMTHLLSTRGPRHRLRPGRLHPQSRWRLLALVLASVVPFAVLIAGYAAAGSLADVWWAIRYGATTFVNAVGVGQKLVNGIRNSLLLALMYAPLLGAAIAFAIGDHHDHQDARQRLLVPGAWLVGAFVAVCAGGRFYPHYYIQLLPPLALLVGGFVGSYEGREGLARSRRLDSARDTT